MKHFTAMVTLERPVQGHPAKRVECRVDLAVDVDRLTFLLGSKAIRNKSKRSRLLSGIIACEVRTIEGATS